MSERDAMWREDLADSCRGVSFHVRHLIKAVRAIETMPSDFRLPVIDELAATETDLTEALLAVKLMRGELDRKPRARILVDAE